MADVNANIGVNIDTTQALAQLKSLQRQISQFHTSIAKSSETAALAQRDLQRNFINSINSLGAFSAELRTVRTTSESFTDSLEKNKFSMREYFRYAGGATKTFGRLFKSEFDTIGKVAEDRVKRLQTQYIKLGRDTTGAMKAIAVIPNELDLNNWSTRTQLAAQRQAIFNQLVRQGSTNLLNFGKNTQWAGRQLMVGFTLPLATLGTTASRVFMEMEAASLKFRKVYGDLFTPREETQKALEDVTALGQMFTKYGISVASTVGLAAEAAAAGFQGIDLQRQTTEATRLSVLGQIDQQKALETTISLQNAFGMSSDKLADSINFLNAVENQTVVSLDDITTAIPKVAPVIQQLGGDVKDLTFFIAAMKEGGINASEGANALKSGLAALINPTKRASDMLAGFGINAKNIVQENRGDLKATVIEFANALNQLDPLNRAQAIEQMFGKFQFARLSTLFANVAKDGNQASRVLSLANSSVQELSALSEQELGMTADSSMNKFKKSVEDLKLALVPVGETFLQAVTPIVEFIGGILEKFNNLSSGVKKAIVVLTVAIGAIGPVALMTFGLLANGLANILKGALILRQGYLRLTGQTQILGEQTDYLTTEQMNAAAVAHSLDQSHAKLTQTFTAEANAIAQLIQAYDAAARAGARFAATNPGMMAPPRRRGYASGVVSVPGPKGAGDVVPAMLSPGEAVIPAEMAKRYAPLIQGMVAGNIPGYQKGLPGGADFAHITSRQTVEIGQLLKMLEKAPKTMSQSMMMTLKELAQVFGNELKTFIYSGLGFTQSKQMNIAMAGNRPVSAQEFLQDFDAQGIQKWNKSLSIAGVKVESVSDELASYDMKLREAVSALAKFDKNATITSSQFATIEKEVRSTLPEFSQLRQALNSAEMALTEIRFNIGESQAIAAGLQPYQVPSRKFPGQMSKKKKVNLPSGKAIRLHGEHFVGRGYGGMVGGINASSIVEAQAAQIANQAVLATAQAAGTQSPSRKTIPIGEDIARGLQVGMANQTDETSAAGANLASAAVSGTQSGGRRNRRVDRPQGPPGIMASEVVALSAMSSQTKKVLDEEIAVRKTMQQKLSSMNNALMAGTFALTSLAGAGSMAGGKLGELSQAVFKYSGLLFGLMSITQLLTQQKVLELAASRASTAGLLVQDAATRKFSLVPGLFAGGLKKIIPNLLRFGGIIARFLGPVGLVISGLFGLKKIVDLYNSSKEKERLATEGLADAMTMTSDKVKFLAGLLGQTPTARAGSGATISANQLTAEERTRVEELRGNKEFLEKYKNDIEAIKTATVEEAQIAFNAIALDLGGQGFEKEAVKAYIDALGEEAGRTEVSLKFKQIDLSTEEGVAAAIKLAKDTTAGFNKAFKDGIKTTRRVVGGGKGGVVLGPEEIKLTTEQQKSLNMSAAALGNTFTALTSAFGNQTIKAQEYNKQMAAIASTIPQSTEGMMLMDKVLLNVSPKFAEASKGIKDYDTKMLLLRASLVNASVAETIFQDLISKNPIKVAAAKRALEQYRTATDALAKNVVIPDPFQEVDTGSTEKSPFQKAKEQLVEQRKELENTRKSYSKLKSAGIETGRAFDIAKDPILAAAIATTKVGSSKWKELLKLIKQVNIESKKVRLTPEEMVDVAERSVEVQYRSAIKNGEAAVKTAEKAVEAAEKDISKIQDSIEKKQRNIELTFNRPIEALQSESSLLSEQLKDIDKATEAINAKYDLQEKALTKISEINQEIAQQEKARLTIADALSQGDIAAAASAAQQMRADAAENAIQRNSAAIQAAREAEIAGLRSASGLTKDQIAARQFEIEKQIFALEQQRATATAAIRIEEDQIYSIQQGKLLTAQNSLLVAQEDLKNIIDRKDQDLERINQLKQFYEDEKLAEEVRRFNLGLYTQEVKRSQREAQGVLDRILALNRTVVTTHIINTITKSSPATPTTPSKTGGGLMYGGKIKPMNMGGFVPEYLAQGGRIGSDTVPTMLTPGEFVVNRSAARSFGPMLTALNESKYPSMLSRAMSSPSYNFGSKAGSIAVPAMSGTENINDNSSTVYNYNVGITVGGTNANPDRIAKAVMNELRYVDSQRIRNQRA